jgi:hypothetical protein
MKKVYRRLMIIFLAALLCQGCTKPKRTRSIEDYVKYLKKRKIEIQNVFYYAESPKMQEFAERIGGRVAEITSKGVSVMIIEKENAQEAEDYAAVENRGEGPASLEYQLEDHEGGYICHAKKNLVLMIRKKDAKENVSLWMIMWFKSF